MQRHLTTADAEAFAAHVAANLEQLGEFLPWPEVTDTPAGAAEWLGRYQRREEGRVVAEGLWEGDRLVGGGVLFHHVPDQAVVELGVWMAADAEGRGFARAMCGSLLMVARRDLGAERVVWTCASQNSRSRRLAERLGFVYEGTQRSALVLRGRRLDLDVLSLVGSELDAWR